MTCEQLIALLKQQPPQMTAVVDLHSEFAEVTQVERFVGQENGGYVSRAYPDASGRMPVTGRGYVLIR